MVHARSKQAVKSAIQPKPIKILEQLTRKERLALEEKRILEAISRAETPSSAVIIEAYTERKKDSVPPAWHARRYLTEDDAKLRELARQWDEERRMTGQWG